MAGRGGRNNTLNENNFKPPGRGLLTTLSSLKIGSGEGGTGILGIGRGTPTGGRGLLGLPPNTQNSGGSGLLNKTPSLIKLEKNQEPMEKNQEPIVRKGKSGQQIQLKSNYVKIEMKKSVVFMYTVDFDPDISFKSIRYKALSQHSKIIGETKLFDGSRLFIPINIPEQELSLTSEIDGNILKVKIKKIKQLLPNSLNYIQIYRQIVQKAIRALRFTMLNKKYFQVNLTKQIPQHKLEIWPGYTMVVHEEEGGVMLLLDVCHKVLRMDTVYDIITDIVKCGKGNVNDLIEKTILGQSVVTRYKYETYRVDEIDFQSNPMSTFKTKDGDISYFEYYNKTYNITIADKNQPLLLHRKKVKDGNEQLIMLVPELCYATGLTEQQRNNFNMMKSLSEHTRLSPMHRDASIKKFLVSLNENKDANKILSDWNMKIEIEPFPLDARCIKNQSIIAGNNIEIRNQNGEWNDVMKNKLLKTKDMRMWVVISTKRDERTVRNFLDKMQLEAKKFGMELSMPKFVTLPTDKTEHYISEIRKICKGFEIDIAITIFPTNRDDRYRAVKKICYCELGISNQCINIRTITDERKLKSVTQKIVMQINVKLGGVLWNLKWNTALDETMVCGIDVFHDVKKRSVAGFVASSEKNFLSWWSKSCFQSHGQEIVSQLRICLEEAIKNFYNNNGLLPNRIIIYRDGVGDGALNTVKVNEIDQLKKAFSVFPDYSPEFTFIIIQKRISQRFLRIDNISELSNPLPGTIVDHTVTRRNYFDFYIVSQNVRQGTVSPTHYVVVDDNSKLNTDQQQILCYKMCHMYFNWTGTIRVPAPVQNAHKLAAMVGETLLQSPNEKLMNKLFYL